MSVRRELSKYLREAEPLESGQVVKINQTSILAASSSGIKEFQVSNPSSFRTGDRVRFKGPVYLGKVRPNKEPRVYVV